MPAHVTRISRNAFLALAVTGSCHIARPMAVSAQATAAAHVQAHVVAAGPGWLGHVLSLEVAGIRHGSSGAGFDPSVTSRRQTEGVVVWREDRVDPQPTRIVTVAHLNH